ncbi:MAG: sodium:proton antiporter NhaD [Pseudomonadota bacterium]|jgi:Na+/H+ antiporter NhaD/arsenite permease-like protein
MTTTLIVAIFILGYAAITLEHSIKINKAASALVTGILCWTIYMLGGADALAVNHALLEHMGELSGILFFLLGAMVIVELIDAHDGFDIITSRISTDKKRPLLWIVATLAFFLSALLDNLTTTIVIVTLLRKLLAEREDRLLFTGITVIAANAGGVWSPMGDVTTTMLWIGGQISVIPTITSLIIPSMVCLIVPLIAVSSRLNGSFVAPLTRAQDHLSSSLFGRNAVFWIGVATLLFVPVFKTLTHLPPFMGILLGLGVMWVVTELIHSEKNEAEKGVLSVNHAIRKIDTPSILFFLGILLAISALQTSGILGDVARWLDARVGNVVAIGLIIGLLSAVFDNVPLVAAVQAMYPITQYPMDDFFWQFLAYTSGTGGSALIIGSAAGIAAMGLEKINFFWYLRTISLLALIGYLSGAAVFVLLK